MDDLTFREIYSWDHCGDPQEYLCENLRWTLRELWLMPYGCILMDLEGSRKQDEDFVNLVSF